MKRDCWLSPYGEVYYVDSFKHDDAAQEILKDEFPMKGNRPIDFEMWEESGFCRSFQETLEKRGWVRFSTTIDRWSCEHVIGYEENYPKPTFEQIEKMYELTGFDYNDENSYSKWFKFDKQ